VDILAWTASTDGLSLVTAVQLANGITQAMPDGAIHAQGNFVVLKLLEVAEPIDCMPLAGALLPAALRITGEKNKILHGLEIMLKLVFKIVSNSNSFMRQPHLPLVLGRFQSGVWQTPAALCICLSSPHVLVVVSDAYTAIDVRVLQDASMFQHVFQHLLHVMPCIEA
jgi:hypothetical protein